MPDSFALAKVEVAQSPRERFEEFLQSRGKRMTQQRRVLVDFIFSQHEHFDADELFLKVQQAGHTQAGSRPTIYRTLAELEEAGLLRKMTLGNRAVYEHDYGYPQHDHLYCQRCEKLIEFSSDEVKRVRDQVAREHNFRMLGHRLMITGICSDCCRLPRQRRRLDLI